LQRLQFGRRAERLDGDQLELGLEDLGADIGRAEELLPAVPDDKEPAIRDRSGRPSLPEHLEHEEVRLDVEVKACPCCGGALHLAGETVSEMLDWVPARLRVIRIRRLKYSCRACGSIHQAPAPERPIAKGLGTPGLLAHVLVSKYCDHLPLYRQSQIFARQGVELDRSTLANWVGGAAWWLEPLRDRLAEQVFRSDKLFADDTPIPVLDPGRGRTTIGRLWVYARDDRPRSGSDPPAAVYFYSLIARPNGRSRICSGPSWRTAGCAPSQSPPHSGQVDARRADHGRGRRAGLRVHCLGGVGALAGTPRPVIDRLYGEIAKIVATAEARGGVAAGQVPNAHIRCGKCVAR
jgi:transposase